MEQTATAWKACAECAAEMPDFASFCPACGCFLPIDLTPAEKSGSARDHLLGALAYFTFIPASLFLLRDPYRSNSFVRFHSIQCLLCWLTGIALASVIRLLTLIVSFIPVVGPLLALLFVVIPVLAVLFTWIVLVVKAFQGEEFRLPMIGQLAERYSNAL